MTRAKPAPEKTASPSSRQGAATSAKPTAALRLFPTARTPPSCRPDRSSAEKET